MNIQDLTTLLSNYAFPIAACVALFWKMEKDRAEHKEEMVKITEALNNNTLVIQRLSDRLEDRYNDGN